MATPVPVAVDGKRIGWRDLVRERERRRRVRRRRRRARRRWPTRRRRAAERRWLTRSRRAAWRSGQSRSTGAANATSNAETAKGALAQAQSTAVGSSGKAQSTALTSYSFVKVQSAAVAQVGSTATTNAIAQGGGSGQAFVNPGQTAYAFSTALPDKAYSATLIDGATMSPAPCWGRATWCLGPQFSGRITPPMAAARATHIAQARRSISATAAI